jgi:flagellar biosynthesis protein FlhB
VSGVASILSTLLGCFYVSVINPFYFSSMIAHRKQMIEELNLSSFEEKTIKINEVYQYFNLSSYIIQTFLTVLIIGLVLSLIIAALIKKDKQIIPIENKLAN